MCGNENKLETHLFYLFLKIKRIWRFELLSCWLSLYRKAAKKVNSLGIDWMFWSFSFLLLILQVEGQRFYQFLQEVRYWFNIEIVYVTKISTTFRGSSTRQLEAVKFAFHPAGENHKNVFMEHTRNTSLCTCFKQSNFQAISTSTNFMKMLIFLRFWPIISTLLA